MKPETVLIARWLLVGMASATTWVSQAQPHWPQFRGPNGQGVLDTAAPPVHFHAASNLVWSAGLPPGHSSPCIWGERIFLTAFMGGKLQTHAYDRLSGKPLWQQEVPAAQIEKTQPFNNPASPTPVADAERVVVYFGSYGLICYDHVGKELWRKPLPALKNQYGTASSPLLYRDSVILLLDSDDKNSQILALRVQTGEVAWKAVRASFTANWSTPMLWEHGAESDLVVLGSRRLVAYEPHTGKERWSVEGFSPETIGVPVCGEGLLFVSAANRTGGHTDKYQGILWSRVVELDKNGDNQIQRSEVPPDFPWLMRPGLPADNPGYAAGSLASRFASIDTDKDGVLTEAEWEAYARQWGARFAPSLKAIRPGPSGDITASHVVWQLRRGIPEIPSPLYYRNKLYLVRDGGIIQCVRPATGDVLYDGRVGASGAYCASPVGAGGRIYLASHPGTVVVLDAGTDSLTVLARNELSEKIWATPALVENTIYVRTEKHLYAFSSAR